MPNLILGLFAVVVIAMVSLIQDRAYAASMNAIGKVADDLRKQLQAAEMRIDIMLSHSGAPSGKPPRASEPCDLASVRNRKKSKEDEKNSKMTRFQRATAGK